jgi:acyl-CoA reductase-like NAD-dependent aldehyde dehydrogenase
VDLTDFMAGEGRRQYGQTVPSELRDKFAMSIRQPLGVCAVIYDAFLEAFSARVRALRVGNGLESGVDMGPSVSEAQRNTVQEYVADRHAGRRRARRRRQRADRRRVRARVVSRADDLR